MSINWDVLDLLQSFSVFDAACYWVEKEPTNDLLKDKPYDVKAMIAVIEKHTGGVHSEVVHSEAVRTEIKVNRLVGRFNPLLDYGPVPVSRVALERLAEQLGQRPKLLFKDAREMRKAIDAPAYLDSGHPCYSPKLAQAIECWLALFGDKGTAVHYRGYSEQITDWLKEHDATGDHRALASVVQPYAKGGTPQAERVEAYRAGQKKMSGR